MSASQKKAGIILGYLGEAVRMIASIAYTPLMLRILGTNEYGLYQLVVSTISYLSLLNLGFAGAYTRFFTRESKKNEEAVKILNGMYMKLFLLMSFVCILCGVFIVFNASIVFGNKLTTDNINEAKILTLITVFNMALTFPTTVFTCNINANERFTFEKGLNFLQNLLNPFLCFPLLLLGYGNYGIVIVAFTLTVAKLIASAKYCISKLGMKFDFHTFDITVFKELGSFTFFIFINQIIDQINWNVDKYLLGRISGLASVAVYGVGSQLNALYISCSNTISNVFAPQINRLVVDGEESKLTELMTRVGRIQYVVVYLVLSGFLFFGHSFVNLWVSIDYSDAYYVAIILMVPMLVPLIQSTGIEIQRAKNKHQVRSIVYLIMSVLNIILTIPLIHTFGTIGASIGTCISLFLGNIVFMNFYYHIKLGLNMVYYWHEIFKFLFPSMIMMGIGIAIHRLFVVNNWGDLILQIIVYVILYCLMFYIAGFNREEKNVVNGFFLRNK